MKIQRFIHTLSFFTAILFFAGCQNLQELAQLKNVKFEIDSLSNGDLVGIDLSNKTSLRDVNALDVLKLTQAFSNKQVPLGFTLHVGAENPAGSPIQAKLMQMEWALFVQNKQVLTGLFDQPVAMPAGQRVDVPIRVQFNVYEFIQSNASSIFDLARSTSNGGSGGLDLRLSARPTIQTPLGPFKFPQFVDIVRRTVN
jgi:hypothetical protein